MVTRCNENNDILTRLPIIRFPVNIYQNRTGNLFNIQFSIIAYNKSIISCVDIKGLSTAADAKPKVETLVKLMF